MSARSITGKKELFSALRKDQSGQVVVLAAIAMVALLGMVGFVIDVGRVLYFQRELQASTDAAALAGAHDLPNTSAITTATKYSGVPGNYNERPDMPGVSMVSGYPMVRCASSLAAIGQSCPAPANANALVVKQQVDVPLYFGAFVGRKTMTIGASATAAVNGATSRPYNVAIIIDSTPSMASTDDDCGTSEIACALTGVQLLMEGLSPCPANVAQCSISNGNSFNSVDRVGLFTFPQLDYASAGSDYNCANGVPNATQYNYPVAGASSYSPSGPNQYSPSGSTYQVAQFHSDYRLSDDAATLNPGSNLTAAAGAVSNCTGMYPANNGQYIGTYYAPAIYAAQASLVAQKAANPGSQNVLIILSDGDATAPYCYGPCPPGNGVQVFGPGATANGYYPSWVGECAQGVAAANAATAAGTRVYSIAYGSPTTSGYYGTPTNGCWTDVNAGTSPNITPCQAMTQMASAPQYFFSDFLQSTGGGNNGNGNGNGNGNNGNGNGNNGNGNGNNGNGNGNNGNGNGNGNGKGNNGNGNGNGGNGNNNNPQNCYSAAQPVTSLSKIFQAILADLTVPRLIPDDTP